MKLKVTSFCRSDIASPPYSMFQKKILKRWISRHRSEIVSAITQISI